MLVFFPVFLGVLFSFCAARTQAAPPTGFDQGVDVRPVIQQAKEAPVPAGGEVPMVLTPAGAGDKVWISIARPEVAELESDVLSREPIAQNENISIYELETSDLDQLSYEMQTRFLRSPGFIAHDSLASAMQDLSEPPAVPAKAFVIDQGEKVKTILKLVKEESIISAIDSLAAYKNRYYRSATGIASSKWLADHWTELAAGRPDITVTAFKHAAYPQESVILTVRGTTEPDKVVVVGGHIDSVAGGGDTPAPGADDNASGIAVIEEVIRVLTASGYKPAQTLKFIAFAAEEAGLRGSGEIAATFKKEGVAVQGMLNLDMTNYKGSAEDIYFIADYTSADQNAFLGKLVTAYTGYTWSASKCGYGCSDHASWTKNGFAASLPFEAKFNECSPDIHTSKDTLAQMGGRAPHALKFAKLAVAYIVEMAK
jgi:leucyl aminopeptidase